MPTITSAHDLITAVPFLLGFHPSNSLVLLSVRTHGFGMALRIDLPASIEPEEIDLLAHHLRNDEAESVIALAYQPDTRSDGDSLLIAVSAGLVRNGLHVHDSLLVSGGRYRSIICRNESCCPLVGVALPDFEASHMAAEQVIAGIPMPYESMDEMVRSIAQAPQAFDEEWQIEVAKYFIDPESMKIVELRRDGVAAMELLLDDFRVGVGASNRILAARVIGRMSDIQVRDYAMGIHSEDTFDLYCAMWSELLRYAPSGFIAPVACLVAAMAYESGNGALAHKALDRALDDEAGHSLALLLRRVFNAGWPPTEFAKMRAELHPKVIETIFG